MSASPQDDLDPSAFVKRIRELSEKHEQEDALRLSSIEADIEKGRSERAARRAERARSLSPEKTATPPSTATKTLDLDSNAAMEALSPSAPRADAIGETMTKLTSAPEPSRPESPTKSASALARSGTLSWQQRPGSSGGRRPFSGVGSRASEETAEPTRTQIAQSLGSKDPSWFKQTADRGTGSAAYRRNQEDPVVDGEAPRRFGLPGMSRAESASSPVEGATSPPPDS
ncbi:hypothetical protein NA57DRAFT_49819, partial [Rhizodiscina lignyota]